MIIESETNRNIEANRSVGSAIDIHSSISLQAFVQVIFKRGFSNTFVRTLRIIKVAARLAAKQKILNGIWDTLNVIDY